MIQVDPGKRVVSFAHPQLLRDLASFHQISASTFLLQVYDHVFDVPEEETTYWTMIDLSGQIKNLGSELKMLLNSPEFQGCKA